MSGVYMFRNMGDITPPWVTRCVEFVLLKVVKSLSLLMSSATVNVCAGDCFWCNYVVYVM